MTKTMKNKALIWLLTAATAMMPVSLSAAPLPDYTFIAENHTEAVVSVQASAEPGEGGTRRADPRNFLFPFPPEFFDRRGRPSPRRSASQGSGFIIDSEGYVLTNAHVIAGMKRIAVILKDGGEYEAEVVGRDEHTDIALLKIDAGETLPTVSIGDSDDVKVGQWVAAVGSPYGLDQSLTAGIISALRRRLPSDRYVPFIQTDAAVNPGSSGGPLMDLNGNVVGINSQIVSPVQANVGYSFAIPINVAMDIQRRLREDGVIHRGWLGIAFSPLSAAAADAYGLPEKSGVVINEVIPGSPAEKAGLRSGDVVLRLNGDDIDAESLPRIIGDFEPGTEVSLSVRRDGETIDIGNIALASLDGGDESLLGMRVEELSGEMRRRTRLEFGVVVRSIDPDQAPRDVLQNIRPDDIITHMLVNERRREIRVPADLARALKENKKDTELFFIWRQGRALNITVEK